MTDLPQRLEQVLRQRPLCMQQHDLARDLLAIERRRMNERQAAEARAARLAQLHPPLVLGGQGRRARDSANTVAGFMILAAFCLLALAFCAGGLAS